MHNGLTYNQKHNTHNNKQPYYDKVLPNISKIRMVFLPRFFKTHLQII